MMEEYNACRLCPRGCSVNRNENKIGFCKESAEIMIGRADLHFWEEPCISGENGSGTVFFAGCSLGCVYCQNYKLSRGEKGQKITTDDLSEMFLSLQKKGAHNINLVTSEHYAPSVREAVLKAKEKGLKIPVVLNSSGYVTEETLEMLKDVIDIYLVDFKYMNQDLAEKYSFAKNYPEIAKKALEVMTLYKGELKFDEDGMMREGVIVRHLCLPGCADDSKNVIKYVFDKYKENVRLSIMSQYTPMKECQEFLELSRKLTEEEYDEIIDFCIELGIEEAYIQEGDAAEESFIPEFT